MLYWGQVNVLRISKREGGQWSFTALRAIWLDHAMLYPVCINVWWILANQSKQDMFRMRFPCSVEKYTSPPPAFSTFYASNFWKLNYNDEFFFLSQPFSSLLNKANWNIKIQLKRMYWKRLSFYRLFRIQTPLPRTCFSILFAVKFHFRFQTMLIPQDPKKDMSRPGFEPGALIEMGI